MARNKYPEETVNHILAESLRLFLEKGYEHTTIQDILNNLGGLSKGAIYHHFKSKEEILMAVVNRLMDSTRDTMSRIRDDRSLTGRQKLIEMFRLSMTNPNQVKVFETTPDLLKNPQLLVAQFEQIIGESIPVYLKPVIREGMADGTIRTEYPQELAEIIMVMTNLWLNPMVFAMTEEKILSKYRLFNAMLHGIGLDFLDEVEDDFLNGLRDCLEEFQKSQKV